MTMSLSATRPALPRRERGGHRRHDFSGPELETLITLSDPAQLGDLRDARDKVSAIADLFTRRRDPRGLFPLIYRTGLDALVHSLEQGTYRHPDWVETFDHDFARRYLKDLYAHLTGGHVSAPWRHFYELTANDSLSVGRLVAAALNAHIVVDLPEALHAARSQERHLGDYRTISGEIFATADVVIADIRQVYGADLAPLYRLYVLRGLADPSAGQPSVQSTLFHTAANAAFINARTLAAPLIRPLLRRQIRILWRTGEAMADRFAAAGVL
jgi:Family of unknown function (DUF5995)